MLLGEFKRHRINPRVFVDLKRRTVMGIGFYLIVLSMVLLTNGYYLRHPKFSKYFTIFMLMICLLRFLYHLKDYLTPERIELRLDRVSLYFFLVITVLTGVVWGVGFSNFILQPEEQQTYLLMVVSTTGLCAGGVVAFLPSLWLAVAYGFAMLGPAILVMAVYGVNTSLMTLLVLFFVFIMFVGIRGNREYWDALENEFLLEKKTREIQQLSQRDGLTGLYNRGFFDVRLEYEWSRAIRNSSPVSLMICDIDHFKRINDTHGHLAGDEYLRLMAKNIKNVVRRKTDILARFGGEEFVILMADDTRENAIALAEQIRELVENTTLNFDGQIIHTTISFGVDWMIPNPFEQSEMILSNSDNALYEAKRMGRNRVVVHGKNKNF